MDNTNKGHCLQQERRDMRRRNRLLYIGWKKPFLLTHGNHYYEKQLLVRLVPDGTTSVLLRQIFSDYSPIRVNVMNNGKYFYVVFSSERDCAAALKASATQLFQSNLNAHVTLRPLMGYTAFANERPKFV